MLNEVKLRDIAYSMDLLITGFYLWSPWLIIKIGGSTPDDIPYRYPGVINSHIGFAIVLPHYKIVTTHRGSFDNKA